jgi:hypothetical protein
MLPMHANRQASTVASQTPIANLPMLPVAHFCRHQRFNDLNCYRSGIYGRNFGLALGMLPIGIILGKHRHWFAEHTRAGLDSQCYRPPTLNGSRDPICQDVTEQEL